VFGFLFGQFNFFNKDIDEAIFNYDVEGVELTIFGDMIYLGPDLVAKATKIPLRGGAIFSSRKNPKLEKNQMANKICGGEDYVSSNGLILQDSPPRLYKRLIQIILRMITSHHRHDISGDCMRLVIHWVEYRPIDIPYQLVNKMHSSLQDS